MNADDLMPNDGSYFLPKEPVDQTIAHKKEKAQTLEAMTVIQGILDRLDQRIEFYGSVDAMPPEVKTDPQQFMNMHNANEQTRGNLIAEREYIESLIETHAPNLLDR